MASVADASSMLVAIDLGMENIRAAVVKPNTTAPAIIINEAGERSTPVCVGYTDEEIIVGIPAKVRGQRDRLNTISNVMFVIGLKAGDADLAQVMNDSPLRMGTNAEGDVTYQVKLRDEDIVVTATEVLAEVFKDMRRVASDVVGFNVVDVVLTLSSSLKACQVGAVKAAAGLAGLAVVDTVPALVAIAIAHNLDVAANASRQTVLVVDSGVHTKVGIIEAEAGIVRVLCEAVDRTIGGDALTGHVAEYFNKEFSRKHTNADLKSNKKSAGKLQHASQIVKHTLSSSVETSYTFESIHEGNDFSSKLTRSRYESASSKTFKAIVAFALDQLAGAGIEQGAVAAIILTGGTAWTPKLRTLFTETVPDIKLDTSIHSDEDCINGAALHAWALLALNTRAAAAGVAAQAVDQVKAQLELDVTPWALTVEAEDGSFLSAVPKGTPVPVTNFVILEAHAATTYVRVHAESEAGQGRSLVAALTLEGTGPKDGVDVDKVTVRVEVSLTGALTVKAQSRSGASATFGQ